jgi:hypothetical protein
MVGEELETVGTEPDEGVKADAEFIDSLYERIKDVHSEEAIPAHYDIAKPNALDNILLQRQEHRDSIFDFIIKIAWASFALIMIPVFIQIHWRLHEDPSFTVLDGNELEILAAAVFVEIIGIVAVITHSLWNDKDYMPHISKRR